MDRDAALNSLESAVFDYSNRMEEEEFTKFGTKEEVDLILASLHSLKVKKTTKIIINFNNPYSLNRSGWMMCQSRWAQNN
jgi:hypothetical protein